MLGKHVGRLLEQRIFPGASRTLSHLSLPRNSLLHTQRVMGYPRAVMVARRPVPSSGQPHPRHPRCSQRTCSPQPRAVGCILEWEAQKEGPKSPGSDRTGMDSHASSLSITPRCPAPPHIGTFAPAAICSHLRPKVLMAGLVFSSA